MASQTLTNVTRNYDDAAISGLLNGEAIVLNNSSLVINSDTRWGQQAAVLGAVTISSALGGTVTLDGRDVWWIPFDASSGLVPALGAVGVNDVTGSIAGAGEFLGVFPTTMLAPLTAGSAMPSSGFIKLRRKTASFVDNEIMTFAGGATATINSATGGQVGWIHVVGAEASTITVPRLGKLTSIGDYFQLGVTNGLDDQTFQFPIADTCPAFQMETAVGSGVYEWWLCAGDRWGTATQFVSTDERGKYFGINKTTGVITIAQRATNACGFKPIAGLRVRIPNVITSSSTSANWALNTVNATAATRYDLTTTNAGEIDIQHMTGNWFLSASSAFSVSIKNSALLAVTISNLALQANIENIGFGIDTSIDLNTLIASGLFSGLTIKNCRTGRYGSFVSGGAAFSVSDCKSLLIEDTQVELFGAAASTERGISTVKSIILNRCVDVIMTNIKVICGTLSFNTCSNVVITNYKSADRLNGTTTATVAGYAVEFTASTANVLMDGYSSLYPDIANIHPYLGIVSCVATSNLEVRNIGTPTARFEGGTVNAAAVFFAASTSTNITLRRCYFQNLRLGLFTIPNTNSVMTIENVWGDGNDSTQFNMLATTPKGGYWLPTSTGATAVYGTHVNDGFVSSDNGRIQFAANEALATTTDQIAITGGTPKFSSAGSIQMPTVGDQVTWTMPYFAIGHTGLGGQALTSIVGINLASMDYDYQIDTGSGFSTWKHLMTVRTRASGGVSGGNTVVITAATGSRQPQIGDYIGVLSGAIPNGTTVTGIAGNTITFSNNLTASLGVGVDVFFWTAIEAEPSFSAATGVKLKVRATTMIASSTNQVNYINIVTKTNSTDQQLQYPLPTTLNEARVIGIEVGSRIRVYNTATSTEISNEIVTGTEWSLLYSEGSDFTDGDVIEVRIAKSGYLPNSFLTVATSTGWSSLASQEVDAVYSLNAINGSTVTELSGDFPNVQIDSNDADGETTVQRIYAWFSYIQTTEQGIRDFFEAMVAEDEVNYRVRSTVANLKLDNTIATPLMIVGGRLYRDDGTTVIASTSNSIQLDPLKAYPVEVGTSGLTPTESATLAILGTLTEDVSGMRFTTKALEQAPSGGGSLTASDVWEYSTRTISTPIPTASQNATAVRSELATELGRIDVATSSRNAVAPDNANIALIKAKTDTLVNTDLTGIATTANISALNNISAAQVRAQVDDGLAAYDAPTKAELDSAIASIPSAPSASTVASAVRTELSTELGRVDVAISTRNAVAPDNSGITAIKAKTDNLPSDPATETTSQEIKSTTKLIPAAL
jgi:hypothetical protein